METNSRIRYRLTLETTSGRKHPNPNAFIRPGVERTWSKLVAFDRGHDQSASHFVPVVLPEVFNLLSNASPGGAAREPKLQPNQTRSVLMPTAVAKCLKR